MWRSALVGLYANQPTNRSIHLHSIFPSHIFSLTMYVTRQNGMVHRCCDCSWFLAQYSCISGECRVNRHHILLLVLHLRYIFCGKIFLLWKQYTFRACIGVKTKTSQFDHQKFFSTILINMKKECFVLKRMIDIIKTASVILSPEIGLWITKCCFFFCAPVLGHTCTCVYVSI